MIQRTRPGFPIARSLIPLLEKASQEQGASIELPDKPVVILEEDTPRKTQPDLIIRKTLDQGSPGSAKSAIVLVIDIDIRSCGRNEDFSKKLKLYEEAGIAEHWLSVPADGIVVVRRSPRFKKPIIYEPGQMIEPVSYKSDPVSVSSILGL